MLLFIRPFSSGKILYDDIFLASRSTISSLSSTSTLDGDTLRTEATAEKEDLVTTLREMLEQSSGDEVLQEEAQEAEHTQDILRKVPLKIYIG